MGWNDDGLTSSSAHIDTSSKYSYYNFVKKPIEIYVFIDLLCAESWAIEPYLKKLTMEYGRLFTIRPIISSDVHPLDKGLFDKPRQLRKIWEKTAKRTGMGCNSNFWKNHSIPSSWDVPLAIKAAELQGKRAGKRYLREVQECLFLNKKNVTEENVLIECAANTELDVDVFKEDLHSASAKKALHDDLQLLKEMDIDYVPTIVFFNQLTNEPGIKVSGVYPYDVYVEVLYDILRHKVEPVEKPPLEVFLAHYKVVACKEVAVVYDWSMSKARKEMKKLQLKQCAKEISAKYGSFWEYIKT